MLLPRWCSIAACQFAKHRPCKFLCFFLRGFTPVPPLPTGLSPRHTATHLVLVTVELQLGEETITASVLTRCYHLIRSQLGEARLHQKFDALLLAQPSSTDPVAVLGLSVWGAVRSMVLGWGHSVGTTRPTGFLYYEPLLCKSLVLMPRVKLVEKYTKHAC